MEALNALQAWKAIVKYPLAADTSPPSCAPGTPSGVPRARGLPRARAAQAP